MRVNTLLVGTAMMALVGTALPAAAEDSVYIPLLTYRTGAFAGSGIPIADGMHDYFKMLNARDGGIGGVKIVTEECETGYTAQKGVECYEATKAKGALVYNPWSTGITLPLIPKAAVDKIPILSMAYGLSASSEGDTFPWIFNPPDTYWDGMSMIIKYIASQEGGLDKLKGKKIGYLYLDAGYGKEPLPFLADLSKELGFETKLYPVPAAEMQNQSAQWLNVRRDRPDYMIMYGWGAMQPTAIKEAAKTNYPMEKFISIWWPSEEDAKGAGQEAVGEAEADGQLEVVAGGAHGGGHPHAVEADLEGLLDDHLVGPAALIDGAGLGDTAGEHLLAAAPGHARHATEEAPIRDRVRRGRSRPRSRRPHAHRDARRRSGRRRRRRRAAHRPLRPAHAHRPPVGFDGQPAVGGGHGGGGPRAGSRHALPLQRPGAAL